MMKKNERKFWHEQFSGEFQFEAFPWTGVDPSRNGIELDLAEPGDVCSFGQILSQQTVGVLVVATLPSAMGIAPFAPAHRRAVVPAVHDNSPPLADAPAPSPLRLNCASRFVPTHN